MKPRKRLPPERDELLIKSVNPEMWKRGQATERELRRLFRKRMKKVKRP